MLDFMLTSSLFYFYRKFSVTLHHFIQSDSRLFKENIYFASASNIELDKCNYSLCFSCHAANWWGTLMTTKSLLFSFGIYTAQNQIFSERQWHGQRKTQERTWVFLSLTPLNSWRLGMNLVFQKLNKYWATSASWLR